MRALLVRLGQEDRVQIVGAGQIHVAYALGRRGLAETWSDHTGDWAIITEAGRALIAKEAPHARSGPNRR